MIKELRFKIALQSMPILLSFVYVFCVMAVAVLSGIMSANSLRSSKALISDAFFVQDRNIVVDEEKFVAAAQDKSHGQAPVGYVVYDAGAQMLFTSAFDESLQQNLNVVVFEGLQKNTDSVKTIEHEQQYYHVLTHIIKEEGGTWAVQIVRGITEEKKILTLFAQAMAVTGVAGIGAMVLIGWYFAGKRLQPIEEAYLRQNRFIGDASHELKTPLTIVQTNVDVMRVKAAQTIAENEKWLDNIENEVTAMRRLIDDMLLLASVERAGLDLEIEEIDLSRLISDICARQVAMAQAGKITLHYEEQIQSDIIAMADISRIEQLVKIFIDNAIKYNNPGGNIWVRLRQKHHDVLLEFQDDGIGMEADQALYVFERFYRADGARHRQSGSIGLGLSVAKEIISAHDGIVQVESEKDVGTLFKIVFYKMAVNENSYGQTST